MAALWTRWTRIVCAAALAVLVCGQVGERADAQSLSRMRSRLQQRLQRKDGVEARLRSVKAEQTAARQRLAKVQDELVAAQARLRAARRKLEEVRAVLRQVKAEQQHTEARLSRHSKAMSERLLAMYQVGMPSYLEVVLNATDFADFANRAEVTRRFAQQDQRLLSDLVATKRELARQRATLEQKEAESARLRTQIQKETAAVADRTRQQQALVKRASRNRALLEAEWDQHEQAVQQIQEYIRQLASGRGIRYTGTCAGQFLMPLRGRLTSPYGWRIHPIFRVRKFHSGIDIAAPTGTPIKAAEKGLVIHSGRSSRWAPLGKCVIIDHGSGWVTYYGHCSSLLVKKGDLVTRGQLIARVGSTGRSTGPHLHWTVSHNGQTVDPLSL